MTLNLRIIGTRLGVGLGAGAALAAKQPDLLRTVSGRITLAAVALVAALPTAPGSAGILRPATPGQLSLVEKIGSVVQTLMDTPAATRRQKAKEMAAQGLRDALADPQALATLTQELQRRNLWQPGQAVPAGAATTQATGEQAAPQGQTPPTTGSSVTTGLSVTTANVPTDTDPAIRDTGGSQ